jgi:hypothetical protein
MSKYETRTTRWKTIALSKITSTGATTVVYGDTVIHKSHGPSHERVASPKRKENIQTPLGIVE